MCALIFFLLFLFGGDDTPKTPTVPKTETTSDLHRYFCDNDDQDQGGPRRDIGCGTLLFFNVSLRLSWLFVAVKSKLYLLKTFLVNLCIMSLTRKIIVRVWVHIKKAVR